MSSKTSDSQLHHQLTSCKRDYADKINTAITSKETVIAHTDIFIGTHTANWPYRVLSVGGHLEEGCE